MNEDTAVNQKIVDKVVVRIWNPALSEGCVGHVSLEVVSSSKDKSFYASFWPQGKPANNLKVVTEKRQGVLLDAATDDYSVYERVPETVICLYSLNITKIRNKFDLLISTINVNIKEPQEAPPVKEKSSWTLLGSLIPGKWFFSSSRSSQSHNCASFVYQLLYEGGIEELVSGSPCSRPVATPRWIGSLANRAKTQELKLKPETAQYEHVYQFHIKNEVFLEKENIKMNQLGKSLTNT